MFISNCIVWCLMTLSMATSIPKPDKRACRRLKHNLKTRSLNVWSFTMSRIPYLMDFGWFWYNLAISPTSTPSSEDNMSLTVVKQTKHFTLCSILCIPLRSLHPWHSLHPLHPLRSFRHLHNLNLLILCILFFFLLTFSPFCHCSTFSSLPASKSVS